MQMLARLETAGYAAWKTAFDERAEDRSGMTMMQMWHDVDDANRVLILFDVHDRARAAGWVSAQSALGTRIDAAYLRTV